MACLVWCLKHRGVWSVDIGPLRSNYPGNPGAELQTMSGSVCTGVLYKGRNERSPLFSMLQ